MPTFDPNRREFEPYGFTCVRWRPSRMRRADRHNEIELNYLESGSITYWIGGTRERVGAGRLVAFWAAIPHQVIDFRGGSEYYVATVPLAWFLGWRLAPAFEQALLQGRLVRDRCPVPAVDAGMFAQWTRDVGAGSAEADQARREMEARVRRLCLGFRGVTGRTDRPTGAVEKMAWFVAQHHTSAGVGVEEISRHAGLHPNYAMALFKRSFGTTLLAYLTAHRISHAKRLLATTDRKVLDVALDSGFGSISRFHEAFREVCGCTPRVFRQAMRG